MFTVLKSYTFIDKDWQIMPLILIIPFGALLLFSDKKHPSLKTTLILLFGTFFTFSFYHWMETPIIRASFFLSIPLIFCLVLNFHHLLKTYKFSRHLYIVASLALTARLINFAIYYQPIPQENWKGVAEKIENEFKAGMLVYCNFRPNLLGIYLSADYPIVDEFDSTSFVNSKLIYIQSNFNERTYPSEVPFYSSIQIPQRRGGYQEILFSESSSSIEIESTLSLSAPCCGWTVHDFSLEHEITAISFQVDSVYSTSNKYHFHLLLQDSRQGSDILWVGFNETTVTPGRQMISIQNMTKVGNPDLSKLNKLTFRIKNNDEGSETRIFFSNINVKY